MENWSLGEISLQYNLENRRYFFFNFNICTMHLYYLINEPTNAQFIKRLLLFVCFWRDSPQWATASTFTRFLDHTQRRTTLCRTPLDEWSARRRDLYLTTHNTHNRQTSMLPAGFEPTISASQGPQTYDLDRAATGPANNLLYFSILHSSYRFRRYCFIFRKLVVSTC